MFQGRSGARYRFQAWPMETRFKTVGGIYIVTKRECLDRTFQTMATHHWLAVGQTNDLGALVFTKPELSKLAKQGANCICVYAVAGEALRQEIEQDLIEGNQNQGWPLQYLVRAELPPAAPEVSEEVIRSEAR